MARDRIRQIETYARQSMSTFVAPDLRIGHDFKHVDRVRHWAIQIARNEGFEDIEAVDCSEPQKLDR